MVLTTARDYWRSLLAITWARSTVQTVARRARRSRSRGRKTAAMRIVLVVPGGVDPPGSPRTIPFIHHLVERLSADHRVTVLAVGHDPQPGEWRLFEADVVNIPIGEHSKSDIL